MCIIITVIISYIVYIEEKNKAKQRLPSKENATTQATCKSFKESKH